MEKYIGTVVLKHLCHKLHVHVLDIDLLINNLVLATQLIREQSMYLQIFIEHHDRFIQFLLQDLYQLLEPGKSQ